MGRIASVAEPVLELEGHWLGRLPAEVGEGLRHPVAGVARRWLDFEGLLKRLTRGAEVPSTIRVLPRRHQASTTRG